MFNWCALPTYKDGLYQVRASGKVDSNTAVSDLTCSPVGTVDWVAVVVSARVSGGASIAWWLREAVELGREACLMGVAFRGAG